MAGCRVHGVDHVLLERVTVGSMPSFRVTFRPRMWYRSSEIVAGLVQGPVMLLVEACTLPSHGPHEIRAVPSGATAMAGVAFLFVLRVTGADQCPPAGRIEVWMPAEDDQVPAGVRTLCLDAERGGSVQGLPDGDGVSVAGEDDLGFYALAECYGRGPGHLVGAGGGVHREGVLPGLDGPDRDRGRAR